MRHVWMKTTAQADVKYGGGTQKARRVTVKEQPEPCVAWGS